VRAAPSSTTAPAARRTRWLAALGVVGVWSILPPYVGPSLGLGLDVSTSVETADHLIPGLVAAGAATAALLLVRRGQSDSLAAFALLAVCALAGLFETVSHVPLVRDAGGPLEPVGAVILHASPGPVLLALSLWLLLRPPAASGPA
jgi:hypothetical protein